MEKGTSQTRRWVWAPQVRLEMRVFHVGKQRREGAKEGRCVFGMESSVTETRRVGSLLWRGCDAEGASLETYMSLSHERTDRSPTYTHTYLAHFLGPDQ